MNKRYDPLNEVSKPVTLNHGTDTGRMPRVNDDEAMYILRNDKAQFFSCDGLQYWEGNWIHSQASIFTHDEAHTVKARHHPVKVDLIRVA